MTAESHYVEVMTAGPRTTVQDNGRRGSQRYGVSVSGALDANAAVLGNRLVGNEIGGTALECTYGGIALRFGCESVVAVTGARAEVAVSGISQPMWTTLLVPTDATLTIGSPTAGSHVYLAVQGGIGVPAVLGSRSTHLGTKMGGLHGKALRDGDRLPTGNAELVSSPSAGTTIPREFDTDYVASADPIRAVCGAQYDRFTESGMSAFWESEFTVSAVSDRQASRLEGPRVDAVDGRHDIISEAAYFGAVQVPSDGQPIVLLADRQTTGGYAKIASVIAADLGRMAQLAPGSKVRFAEVTVAEAQEIARENYRLVCESELVAPAAAMPIGMVCNSVEYEIAVRRAGASQGDGTMWWAKVDDDAEATVLVT